MAEILTESFCERCGSRYTFESAVPRARMRGVKVLSRGLKNFVLDDKTSIDEAMAAARDDTDRALTSHQLEAFHKTFNFCMQCRQYICPNCWNDADGRCLTCAPLVGHGMTPAPFPHLDPSAGIPDADDGLAAAAMNGHTHVADETNGFDPLARLDSLTVDTTPPPEPEMIGASEVEARAEAAEELAAAETAEDALGSAEAAAAAALIAAEAVSPPELDGPVIEEQAAALESAFWTDSIETEPTVGATAPVEAEAVPTDEALPAFESLEALESLPIEPEAQPEPLAAAVEAVSATPDGDAAAQDAAAALDAAAIEETDETRERRVSAAQETLLLAGLKPGQSLDEAIAAFESEPSTAAEPEPVETAQTETQPVELEYVEAEPVQSATEPVESVYVEAEPVEAVEPDEFAATPEALVVVDAVEPAEQEPLVEPLAAAVVAEVAQPEPASYAEPLDEIPAGEAVVADAPVESAAEPEEAWHPEPLVDLAPAEPVDLEPVLVETVAIEPAVAEPVVVEAAPEPPAPAGPEPYEIAAAAAAVDRVDQPTWSIVAPAPATVDGVPGPIADPALEPPAAPVAPPAQAEPAPAEEPSWPDQPQWPSPQPSSGLAFLGRPMIPTGGVDALWAESDRAVSAPSAGTDKPAGGVQPCVSCGLSLSASARFCRRCGTSQAG